jgi:hypothetical protein
MFHRPYWEDAMENDERPSFTPPYNIPWSTFLRFIEGLDTDSLPPKIDRTYLARLSGNAQTYLMAALRAFGLTGPDNEVTPALKELAQNTEDRPGLIADLLRKHYPELVQLGEANATSGQLDDAFRKFRLGGNTLRKATTFYIHAAQYADIPTSPHWNVRPPGTGRPSTTARRSRPKAGSGAPAPSTRALPVGDTRGIKLRSGVQVTLTLSAPLLSLPREDRKFVLTIIESMEDYESQSPEALSGNAATDPYTASRDGVEASAGVQT